MKVDEWRAQAKGEPSKYRSKKMVVDGIKYDSRREARYVEKLAMLERKGLISDLVRQPRYRFEGLFYDSGRVVTYFADASYKDAEGVEHVVDVKGMRTPFYKLKKALMLKWFGITVEEV